MANDPRRPLDLKAEIQKALDDLENSIFPYQPPKVKPEESPCHYAKMHYNPVRGVLYCPECEFERPLKLNQ